MGQPIWHVDEFLKKDGAIFQTNLPRACMVRTAVKLRFKYITCT